MSSTDAQRIVPSPGSVQAKVLAGLLVGETDVAKLGAFCGFREKQVRGAIDALRARGWGIDSLGKCNFQLVPRRRAA